MCKKKEGPSAYLVNATGADDVRIAYLKAIKDTDPELFHHYLNSSYGMFADWKLTDREIVEIFEEDEDDSNN